MKALLHIFSALLLVALAAGCRPSEAERALRSAEALMETRPDSALTLLEAIDGSRLSGEPRARHALLLSQAYDKNYIDLTDDSLISIAVNFYDNSSDDYRRMLALHYKGTVNRNAGFYESALASALEAHDLALALNDTLNLCRIESLMANLYDHSYNLTEAIKWETSALNLAKSLNRTRWIYNGYINNGNYYITLGQTETAKHYADSAAMIEGMNADIQELLYHVMTVNDNYAIADSIYCKMLTEGNVPTLQIKALQASNPSKGRNPDFDLNKCRTFEECTTIEDSVACYFIMMQAAIESDSTQNLISNLYGVIGLHNVMFTRLMSHSLLKVQTDHESSKALRAEQKLQEKRKTIWLMGLVGLFVAIAAFFAVRWLLLRNRNRRLALEMNLRVLSEAMTQIKAELDESQCKLTTSLEELAESRDKLAASREELAASQDKLAASREELAANQDKLAESRNELAASKQECATLHDDAADRNRELEMFRQKSAIAFLGKFAWLEKLGNMYLDADMSNSSKEGVLYKEVARTVSATNIKKLTAEMTAELTRHDGGIIGGINGLSLAPSEKQILLYFLAGFSHRVICMLTGKSDSSIYNIKKRLRHKLQNTKSALTDGLLAHL